ncbi:MAG: Lrp/AsnC family transcriptional regulator [Candidatus Bathyarchaeia archaeon]
MATAFVFININPGTESAVLKKLRAMPEIKEAHFVYGVYDVIVKVEADSMDHLKEIISWKIRRLDNIRSTLTIIVGEGK